MERSWDLPPRRGGRQHSGTTRTGKPAPTVAAPGEWAAARLIVAERGGVRILARMTCSVLGPGLVGSWLGAAAGSAVAIPGPSGVPRARRVRLAGRVRDWQPRLSTLAEIDPTVPLLIATRVHRTPWAGLPADARAAQNGLGQPRAVITCFFAVDLDDDGVLHATGPIPRVVVGRGDARWDAVFAAWSDAGIEVEAVDDPRPAQWEKTILNATVGPLCLATGLGMGAVWNDAALRELVLAATCEGDAVAAACGIALPAGLAARAERFFAAVGDHRPSLLKDPGELPWVLGHLLRQAERHHLATPALQRIAAQTARRVGAPADTLVSGTVKGSADAGLAG